MGVEDLAPFGDELTLLVMGPGFGESVIVRWPPDNWLVVDSFRKTGRTNEEHPALDVLRTFDARPAALALTHPHKDHAAGFASLIDRRREGGLVGWLGVPGEEAEWATSNADEAIRQGDTEQAIAGINRVWSEDPSSRWNLHAGAPAVQIGDASIDVLSPSSAVLREIRDKGGYRAANRVSSAMLLTWQGCQVLLGADLTNSGWSEVEAERGSLSLSTTSAYKVAHHGSKYSQHAVALGEPPPRDRLSFAAPFNRGNKVPRFEDGNDVALLLARAERLYLTTHHGPLPEDCGTSVLSRGAVPVATRSIGAFSVSLNGSERDMRECWVAASIDSDGKVMSVRRGKESMCVAER